MKQVLLAGLFCSVAFSASAQIPGKRIDGPLEIAGVKFSEGDTLHFGQGTIPNGDFKYINQPLNVFSGTKEMSLPRSFSGRTLIIKGFRDATSKRAGEKLLAVVNPGGFNYAVELGDAVQSGEIVAVNSRKVGNKATAAAAPATSVADELLKLKQLLDAGAINQTEYDQQKKKLLGL